MISVIVPCRNRLGQLSICLDSINAAIKSAKCQIPGIEVEVLVVNDHSEAGFSVEISQRYENCKVIESDGYGPGYARNLGIEKSSGEFIFFTDSDCVVADSWIINGYRIFKQKNPVVIQGVPWLFQKKKNPEFGKCEELLYEIMFRKYVKGNSTVMTDSRNLLLNRAITDYLGREIFSEKTEKATAEDRVFGEKCNSLGLDVLFSLDVKIYHEDPSDMNYVCRQKYRHGSGRVLIWEEKQDFNYLADRYFHIPIAKGLPVDYVLPAHTAFLLGFYNNIKNNCERSEFLRCMEDIYLKYGKNMYDYSELVEYL